MKIDIAKIISISYYNNIKFEYDIKKSHANKEKHGINFEEAKRLWTGPHLIVPAKFVTEPRFILIGKLKEKYYSCCYTLRNESVIRFISVRRSRKNEKEYYDEKYKQKQKKSFGKNI